MAKTLKFLGQTLEFPLADDHFVGVWDGPPNLPAIDVTNDLREALESPIDLPRLGRCVVPGDRIIIAADPRTPELATCLTVIVNILETAGIDRGSVSVLALPGASGDFNPADLPAGIEFRVHQPDVSDDLAYLATTSGGRRVYLNRILIDADFILPLGTIVRDTAPGIAGPWSTLFPGLSDVATRTNFAARGSKPSAGAVDESIEVAWLLGNQFQIGVLPGLSGASAIFAGLANSVRTAGIRAAEDVWTFRVDRRADLVVVGVDAQAGLDATWNALATGAKLARRGGKVVALSDASGPIGAAVNQLIGTENYAAATAALKAADGAADYGSAAKLAEALAWADLYLLSNLDESEVEDLGIMPLGKPAEARRLAASASDIILLSNAELTAVVVEEDDR